jgi:lipopolysaccharide export system permease protein
MLDMMGEIGIPFHTVLTIMMLQLPSGMAFCLPGGVVVAAMIVLTRSSRDNELLALQFLGTPLRRILAPFLLLGVCSSLFSYAISEQVAPQSRDLSRRLFNIAVHQTLRPFPNQSEVRLEDKDGQVTRVIELGRGASSLVDGFVSFDVTQKNVVKLVWAQSARWRDQAWNLNNGKLFEISNGEDNLQVSFASMQLPGTARSKEFLDANYKSTLDKTTRELKADIELAKTFPVAPPPYLYFQYYRRFSHPLSCFFLLVAALPIVLLRRRKGRDFSLLYGGLVVVCFFFMQELCLGLVTNKRLDPLLGAWLPGLGLSSLGLLMICFLRRR